MRIWTKRLLARTPPLWPPPERLAETLKWYSEAFHTLSAAIVQPKAIDGCYGVNATSLQEKLRRVPICQSRFNKVVRSTWRPASAEEGVVIFLDPCCSIINDGNGPLGRHSAWIAVTIPSTLR
jgi:hypothetical protein